MERKRDIINDIHPKDLLHSKDTVVETYDNKFDFIKELVEEGEHAEDVKEFNKQIKNGVDIKEAEIDLIRNTVRNNLIKRGIITGTVYEGWKYDVDGIIVDYAELAAGNSECMMKPVKKYDKYFYELYINMSIPWSVSSSSIKEGAIKLIETIKLLEERNIEIKINVVLYSQGMFRNGDNWLTIIPICNHLEYKDYNLIYPFINGEFLRGPLFQIMKRHDSTEGLGRATKLDNTVNLWELNETELAERVIHDLDMGAL